jgi:Mor family transcriptional regulator
MENKTAPLDTLLQSSPPDLVDRIFDYILSDPTLARAIEQSALAQKNTVPKLKAAVRAEFKGEECYIAGRPASARQELVSKVLALFNGRNASEVARQLGIGRATVYRCLKQPAPEKNRLSFPGNETDAGLP